MRLGLICIVLVLLASNLAYALKIFPTLTELGENYDVEQSFILTVLNDGPSTEQVNLIVDQESYYLEPYVTIEPSEFKIKPNSKKNIQITTDFPKNLSPEKHRLVIKPITATGDGEDTVYSFKVPGIARPDLQISDVSMQNKGGSIVFNVMLNNLGNVIGRASPHITISNESGIVDEMEYESNVMVMPFSKYNLTLLYDPSSLNYGEYKADIVFSYNDNLKTNSKEEDFKVSSSGLSSGGSFLSILGKYKYYFFIGIILFLLIFSIKPEYLKKVNPKGFVPKYPKEFSHRISGVERRIRSLDSDTKMIIAQTQSFIKESNEWFEKVYGKGTFEFK